MTNSIPDVPEGYLAPMTVVVFCVVATPALALVALVALVRAGLNVDPRTMWGWMAGVATASTVLSYLANVLTDLQSIQVGFSATSWFTGIIAGSSLIGLVLSLTGAIPSRQEVREEKPAPVVVTQSERVEEIEEPGGEEFSFDTEVETDTQPGDTSLQP